jgi:hypothetical protein
LFDYILQASISLSETGSSLEQCDKLIELVASSESGMMHLFSQQQLQVTFVLVWFIHPVAASFSGSNKIVVHSLPGIPAFWEGMLDL